MNDVEKIIEMHRFKRPEGSVSQVEFIDRFIGPYDPSRDDHDNRWIIVGEGKPDIVWSCHTDTVHTMPGYQKLSYDGRYLRLHRKASSSCLGADCGAGVWIMLEMIKAGVPGLYVFHADEEHGASGSQGFVKDNANYLAGFRAAIAFDRKGTTSVITHMSCRTCSDAFADSLCAQIGMKYAPDDTGMVTDTKHYRGVVPECTNISVGYFAQHTSREELDVQHLIALRDAMIKIDTTKLVIERDPKSKDVYKSYTYASGGWNQFGDTVKGIVWRDADLVATVLEKRLGIDYATLKKLVEAERATRQAGYDAAFVAPTLDQKPDLLTNLRSGTALVDPPVAPTHRTPQTHHKPRVKIRAHARASAGPALDTADTVTPFPGHARARSDVH